MKSCASSRASRCYFSQGRSGAIAAPVSKFRSEPAPAAIQDYQQLMNVRLDEVVRQLARQPLLFQPGTKWSYSSPGIEIQIGTRPRRDPGLPAVDERAAR